MFERAEVRGAAQALAEKLEEARARIKEALNEDDGVPYLKKKELADDIEEAYKHIKRAAKETAADLARDFLQIHDQVKRNLPCFLATAAYGSPLAPQVVLLRDFRDTRLRRSGWGRTFVAVYERLSPPLAAVIARSEFLRAVTRWMVVAPMVWLAKRMTESQ